MKNILFCQSCGLPLTTEDIKGTENNGLKNNDYCKYCYQDSSFKNSHINLDDMKSIVKTHMEEEKLPRYMVQKAIALLPALKRWKTTNRII